MNINSLQRGSYTIRELMAVWISRQIRDGEVVGGGGGTLAIARAGQLLAHLHHGPNMRFLSLVSMNLHCCPSLSLSLFESVADWRVSRWAEAYWIPSEIYDQLRLFRKRVLFISGIQIDKYGNVNLFGMGNDFRNLDFRGPGGLGAATGTTYAGRYYIFAASHTPRVFVERCDYVTCVGWGEGGKEARRKLGLPGGGPVACITSLCIMDFDEETKRMRLKSIHPGVSISEVIENTGFRLMIPPNVEETEPPTIEELEILRTKVDPEGLLRGSD